MINDSKSNLIETLSLELFNSDVNENITHEDNVYMTSDTPETIINKFMNSSRISKDTNGIPCVENGTLTPTIEWASSLKNLYIENNLDIMWRLNIDLECVNPDIIEILSDAGLKLIDIKVQSVSLTQLKTLEGIESPSTYLSKLEDVLLKSLESGVWVALNILTYPTESTSVIEETKLWLSKHKNLIKYVSTTDFIEDDTNYKLSTLGEGIVKSTEFSKLVTTDSDYYDLKKLVYFKENYSYKDFIEDIIDVDPKSLPFITPWEDKEINTKKVVIFGGMGTGKSLFTEMIEEELRERNVLAHSHNIGDTCRFFMKVGNINPYWKEKTRSLSQQIASKLREVDKDLLNEVVYADIHILDQAEGTQQAVHIVTGGRTLEDFKYWNDKDYLTIGIVSDRNETSERLKTRDVGQVQDEFNLKHETEIHTEFISKNLCKVLIENNGTLDELRDKARNVVESYILNNH